MTAMLLATFFSLQAAQARPVTAATFQPRLTVQKQAAVRPLLFTIPIDQQRAARAIARTDDGEIICGMVVVRKSSDADAQILLPSRETGAAIRRIEPQICTSKTTVQGK